MSRTETGDGYERGYYEGRHERTLSSASTILGHLWEVYAPRTVVDFGCGVGTWLTVAEELGADRVLGVDGPWVPRDTLAIDEKQFVERDLSQSTDLAEKFDLALSLEVAEHIEPDHAGEFVDTLTEHADVVLFSAAIPRQGGVDHVNEQWPRYWASLFEERGYRTVDYVRPRVWRDGNVEWWYAQNTLIFCAPNVLDRNGELKRAHEATRRNQLSVVHPRNYLRIVDSLDHRILEVVRRVRTTVASWLDERLF